MDDVTSYEGKGREEAADGGTTDEGTTDEVTTDRETVVAVVVMERQMSRK